LPPPAIADGTALVCEKYVKKHLVDVSIATNGSGEQKKSSGLSDSPQGGEPHTNLFKLPLSSQKRLQ
jgi:hypothetical protein